MLRVQQVPRGHVCCFAPEQSRVVGPGPAHGGGLRAEAALADEVPQAATLRSRFCCCWGDHELTCTSPMSAHEPLTTPNSSPIRHKCMRHRLARFKIGFALATESVASATSKQGGTSATSYTSHLDQPPNAQTQPMSLAASALTSTSASTLIQSPSEPLLRTLPTSSKLLLGQ